MTQSPKKITIVGAGMWGRALGKLANKNHHLIKLWTRHSDESLAEAIAGAEIMISAVAMKGLESTIAQLQNLTIPDDVIIVTATKGLDPRTLDTPSHLWQQAFPHQAIVVLSGPNLSKEIEQGLPAATVVASQDLKAAQIIQEIFASETFRVYVNEDPLGTELGGTLKNVMAIASGVCAGLNLGTNAQAALLTRALPEMIRVGVHLGADPETFVGLSGLGDLLATCSSPLSRNYQVGYKIAKGKTLEEILAESEGTAEGVNTTNVLIQLAQKEHISVPICYQVYQLLNGKKTPEEAVKSLMARELKPEFPHQPFSY
ncbi:MAG TPA: NAD(P)H-dependent glycerol-3-phosphate dehydrogenase [Allocoleopsis sp.]